MDNRPTWTEIWMDFVESISRKSCDEKTKVGAVIVSDDNLRLLAMGYNGTPHGFPNKRESMEPGKGETIHAEMNALIKLNFSDPCKKVLYTLYSPCPDCARCIIQGHINRVVYKNIFRDSSGLDILRRGNIDVYTLDEAIFLEKQGREHK